MTQLKEYERKLVKVLEGRSLRLKWRYGRLCGLCVYINGLWMRARAVKGPALSKWNATVPAPASKSTASCWSVPRASSTTRPSSTPDANTKTGLNIQCISSRSPYRSICQPILGTSFSTSMGTLQAGTRDTLNWAPSRRMSGSPVSILLDAAIEQSRTTFPLAKKRL